MNDKMIQNTAALFGDLWHRYDDELFEQSVVLFNTRFRANGFDLDWFRGKRCMDAGCGGGRYTIAMSRLGAREVIGCDVSSTGLADARRRAVNLKNVRFEEASVLQMPFPDSSFDFICCSGVLHHTSDPEKGLHELTRILRPNGRLFLLLYGAGGLRWPTVMKIRPHAQAIGYERMDAAMRLAHLPANKQRTFLDDFFVPQIRFYSWDEVKTMLEAKGFKHIERWEKGKLDHEESVPVQLTELEQMRLVFSTILLQKGPRFSTVFDETRLAYQSVQASIDRLITVEEAFSSGQLDEEQRRLEIFGWGHHRVLAYKD